MCAVMGVTEDPAELAIPEPAPDEEMDMSDG